MKNRNRYKDEAFEKWLTSSLESLKEKVKITSSTSYATRNLKLLSTKHYSQTIKHKKMPKNKTMT